MDDLASYPLGECVCTTARHATFYHIAGPADGPAIVFVHGWPEIGLAWAHQMHALAALGYRVIAPDLRGSGRSAPYHVHDAYAQREIVADLIELIDSLGITRALWVGHDWGAAIVWNIARHYPERCVAVAALCIPYATFDRGLETLCALVNRKQYPIETYPAGQFEYIAFYHENSRSRAPSSKPTSRGRSKCFCARAIPHMRGTCFRRRSCERKAAGSVGEPHPTWRSMQRS